MTKIFNSSFKAKRGANVDFVQKNKKIKELKDLLIDKKNEMQGFIGDKKLTKR